MFVLNSFPPRNKTTPSKKYFIKKIKAQLLPITNEYMMNIFDKRAEVRNVKKNRLFLKFFLEFDAHRIR